MPTLENKELPVAPVASTEAAMAFDKLGAIEIRKAPRYLRRAALKNAILAGRPIFEEGYERGFKDAVNHGFKLGYDNGKEAGVKELTAANPIDGGDQIKVGASAPEAAA